MVAPTAQSRPNRNTLWLIGLAIAVIVVVFLALNSRSSIQAGAQRVGEEPAASSSAMTGGRPASPSPGEPGG